MAVRCIVGAEIKWQRSSFLFVNENILCKIVSDDCETNLIEFFI